MKQRAISLRRNYSGILLFIALGVIAYLLFRQRTIAVHNVERVKAIRDEKGDIQEFIIERETRA